MDTNPPLWFGHQVSLTHGQLTGLIFYERGCFLTKKAKKKISLFPHVDSTLAVTPSWEQPWSSRPLQLLIKFKLVKQFWANLCLQIQDYWSMPGWMNHALTKIFRNFVHCSIYPDVRLLKMQLFGSKNWSISNVNPHVLYSMLE